MSKECNHFSQEKEGITPNTKSCEECEIERFPVVAIRMCLTCGHVGCCDSSIGKHATRHYEETGHPVMKAIPGDIWKWCYLHEEYYWFFNTPENVTVKSKKTQHVWERGS